MTSDQRWQSAWYRWGFIPSWATDLNIRNRLINARADTVATKPAFRAAFKQRRCLVIADGFYEWKASGKKKQPYYFQLRDGQPFAFAGPPGFAAAGPVDQAACRPRPLARAAVVCPGP
jgi:putative SOS response-associated peptidase YedK